MHDSPETKQNVWTFLLEIQGRFKDFGMGGARDKQLGVHWGADHRKPSKKIGKIDTI